MVHAAQAMPSPWSLFQLQNAEFQDLPRSTGPESASKQDAQGIHEDLWTLKAKKHCMHHHYPLKFLLPTNNFLCAIFTKIPVMDWTVPRASTPTKVICWSPNSWCDPQLFENNIKKKEEEIPFPKNVLIKGNASRVKTLLENHSLKSHQKENQTSTENKVNEIVMGTFRMHANSISMDSLYTDFGAPVAKSCCKTVRPFRYFQKCPLSLGKCPRYTHLMSNSLKQPKKKISLWRNSRVVNTESRIILCLASDGENRKEPGKRDMTDIKGLSHSKESITSSKDCISLDNFRGEKMALVLFPPSFCWAEIYPCTTLTKLLTPLDYDCVDSHEHNEFIRHVTKITGAMAKGLS